MYQPTRFTLKQGDIPCRERLASKVVTECSLPKCSNVRKSSTSLWKTYNHQVFRGNLIV